LLKALNLLDASKDEPRREFTVGFKDLFSPLWSKWNIRKNLCLFSVMSPSVAASRVDCPFICPISRDSAYFRCSNGSFERAPRRCIQAATVEAVGIDVAPSTPQCYDRDCSRESGKMRRAAKRERRAQVREAPLSQRA
jgi:hypothetical protein